MLTTILPSCKKFVTVETPPNILTTEKVFADDRSATSAIVSIYIDMMNYQFGGDGSFVCFSMTALAGFSGNEFEVDAEQYYCSGFPGIFSTWSYSSNRM
jgi:hypothetical protein